MSTPTELPTISVDDLDDVTGGVTTASPSSSNAQVSAALQSVTSSIASLASQQNTSGSSLSQLLPIMLMARGAGGGCPCGCGMANCIRR